MLPTVKLEYLANAPQSQEETWTDNYDDGI